MTLKFSFIAVVTVALVFAVPAFGDSWGADQTGDRQRLTGRRRSHRRSEAAGPVEHPRRARAFLRREAPRDDRGGGGSCTTIASMLDPSSGCAHAAISAAHDIEWLQIGIGFGFGVLLAVGLVLAMRITPVPPAGALIDSPLALGAASGGRRKAALRRLVSCARVSAGPSRDPHGDPERVREPVHGLRAADTADAYRARSSPAETALRVIEAEVDFEARLEVAGVPRAVEVARCEMARREADRRSAAQFSKLEPVISERAGARRL